MCWGNDKENDKEGLPSEEKNNRIEINSNVPNELFDILNSDEIGKEKEVFNSLNRLSRLFIEWSKHPELSFIELYNSVCGGNNEYEDIRIRQDDGGLKPNIDDSPSYINNERDFCLFNLTLDHKHKFKLSEFLRKNFSKQQYNYDLINTILYTFFDNFCEQLEYFAFFEDGDTIDNNGHINIQNPEKQSILNFSAVKLQKPESLSLKDCTTCIRNAIAHKEYHIIQRDEMYIKTDYNNGFEAIIDLSFFDDCFNFAQHSKTLPLDYTKNENWVRRAFKYENIDGTQIPSINAMMLDDPQKTFPDIFTNDYKHVGINTNDARRDKERVEWLLANDVNFWLISDTNKPYVHNLFNAVLLSVLETIFENPNITYKDLVDKATISKLCDKLNLFSMDDRYKIISLCMGMIWDVFSLWKLKMFYINMLDIPENNRTLEQQEDAHKRNALIHWYYNIANWIIIMWDIDKRNWWRMSWDKHIYSFADIFADANFQNKLQKSMSRGVSLWPIEKMEEITDNE